VAEARIVAPDRARLLTRLSHYADPVGAFFVINAVFQTMWSYFIITFNDVDATGRFVAVYGTASHMALAVGPYVGGLFIVDRSYAPLLWFGVIAVSACYACFLAAIGLGRAATRVTNVTLLWEPQGAPRQSSARRQGS
jgi:predicted MFS family arabinose efflux permease